MSWRSGDYGHLLRPQGWPITLRLSLLYMLAAFIVLTFAALVPYHALIGGLEREDRELLGDKLQTLETLVKERAQASVLEHEVKWEGTDSLRSRFYSRIRDAHLQVELETPGMSNMLPGATFPVWSPPFGENGAFRSWKSHDGSYYLLASAVATTLEGEIRHIEVALDVSDEHQLLGEYRQKLFLVLVLGVITSGIGGWAVARRGLRPLREMTAAVQRISANQLDQHLEVDRWPRELSSLAQAFDQMLGRLHRSFSRLSQFSADLAHELRTPVNNLMGEMEVALAHPRAPEDYREVLGSSLEECAKLAKTIDSMLFLARADMAQMPLEKSRFDGRAEIDAVADYYEAVADEQGVRFRCEGAAPVEADRLLFRRAVANLVANAIRYTPEGGEVVVQLSAGDSHADVLVRDTGCGIEAEHQDRVFDRFYRVRGEEQGGEGVGLGLAIVKSIVDLHRGKIDLESAEGRGTSIRLRFPLGQPRRAP